MSFVIDEALDLSDDETSWAAFEHPTTGAELKDKDDKPYFIEVWVKESDRMKAFVDNQSLQSAFKAAKAKPGQPKHPKESRAQIAKILAHAVKDCYLPVQFEGGEFGKVTEKQLFELINDGETVQQRLFGESLKTQIALQYGDSRFLSAPTEQDPKGKRSKKG